MNGGGGLETRVVALEGHGAHYKIGIGSLQSITIVCVVEWEGMSDRGPRSVGGGGPWLGTGWNVDDGVGSQIQDTRDVECGRRRWPEVVVTVVVSEDRWTRRLPDWENVAFLWRLAD